MPDILLSIGSFIQRIYESSSSQADEINRLFNQFLILSAAILIIVSFMVLVGAYRYRESKRKGKTSRVLGNKRLEFIWSFIPLVIVTIFFFLSLRAMNLINDPVDSEKDPDIHIIAKQWWWDMRYPKQDVITANELHIPVGEKLKMKIESGDVIHSWWVPALGRKIDAIPGHTNYGWIEADSVGVYEGTCSEYCGMQHAWMRIKVIAEPREKFEAWIAGQQKPAVEPSDSLAAKGSRLFQKMTCGSCHAIAGTDANKHIGPDLTHFGSRTTMLSGLMENNPQNLRKWLHDPQAVKHGAYMPNFLLDDQEVNALASYLESLK